MNASRLIRDTTSRWRTPLLLVALSLVPALAGLVRLADTVAGGPVTAANARFIASPAPILLHVVGATLYSLLGAFQFGDGVRRRWHRRAGVVAVVAGLVAASSGVWMALAYPISEALQGPLLQGVRVLVGGGMFAALVLAMRAIWRRDVPAHEAWMIRAYALGQGAGTQAVLLLPWTLAIGDILGPARDVWLTVAWAVNVIVAELIVRARRQPRMIAAAAATTGS